MKALIDRRTGAATGDVTWILPTTGGLGPVDINAPHCTRGEAVSGFEQGLLARIGVEPRMAGTRHFDLLVEDTFRQAGIDRARLEEGRVVGVPRDVVPNSRATLFNG